MVLIQSTLIQHIYKYIFFELIIIERLRIPTFNKKKVNLLLLRLLDQVNIPHQFLAESHLKSCILLQVSSHIQTYQTFIYIHHVLNESKTFFADPILPKIYILP